MGAIVKRKYNGGVGYPRKRRVAASRYMQIAKAGYRVGRAVWKAYRRYKRPTYRKKSLVGTVKRIDQIGTFSKQKYYKKRRRADYLILKPITVQYWQTNGTGRSTAPVGKQSITDIGIGSRTDWVSIRTSLGFTDKAQDIYVDSLYSKITFANRNNEVVNMTLYDVRPRRSTPKRPYLSMSEGYTDLSLDENVLGSTPFQSKQFCQEWKVERMRKVQLAPGMQHEHTIYNRVNKHIKEAYWANSSQENDPYFGFSSVLVIFSGSVQNDSTTDTQISTGLVDIDVMYQHQYKFYVVNPRIVTSYQANNLPTAFTVGEATWNVAKGEEEGHVEV